MTSASSTQPLLAANVQLLGQLGAVLGRVSASQYTQPPTIAASPLGMHVRHIIEFYQELLRCAARGGTLCYDNRQRNHSLETSLAVAVRAVEALQVQLTDCSVAGAEITLSVTTAANGPRHNVATTFQRELHYVLDHAVHHCAIIGMIATSMEVHLPADFGMAPATQAHIAAQGAV